MTISLGQLVKSKTGRDKGRFFIVVGILNEDFVLISDGDLRKIEKPKKKRIKHLEITDKVIEELRYKLSNKSRIINSEISKMLLNLDFEGNEN